MSPRNQTATITRVRFWREAAVRGPGRVESSMPDATKGFVAFESQR